MKLRLVNHAILAANLAALAIMLSVWLTRTPLTVTPAPDAAPATPAKPPVKTHPAKPTKPFMPLLSLSPASVDPPAIVAPKTTIEVPVSYEVAPLPAVLPTVKVMAFTASWCGPCQQAKPTLAAMKASGVNIESIDIDKQPALAREHKVARVPTFLVFEDKQLLLRTNDVAAMAAQIKRRGILGITMSGPAAAIKTILAHSAAKRVGLRVGDTLTHVNGRSTPTTTDLTAAIRRHLPGATVNLTIQRGTATWTVKATLGAP